MQLKLLRVSWPWVGATPAGGFDDLRALANLGRAAYLLGCLMQTQAAADALGINGAAQSALARMRQLALCEIHAVLCCPWCCPPVSGTMEHGARARMP